MNKESKFNSDFFNAYQAELKLFHLEIETEDPVKVIPTSAIIHTFKNSTLTVVNSSFKLACTALYTNYDSKV